MIAIGLTVATALVFILVRLVRHRYIKAALVVIVPFVDLVLNIAPGLPRLNVEELHRELDYERIIREDRGFHRVAMQGDTVQGVRFGSFGINGYTPMAVGQYFQFIYAMAGLPVPERKRSTLDPALFVTDRVFTSRILGVKYAQVRTPRGRQVLAATNPHPRATLVREAVLLPVLSEHLERLKSPDFDPLRSVLLESGPDRPSPSNEGSTTDDRVTIESYQPNRLQLRSHSDSDTYLVLSELYYPGWLATVDGEGVPILRANYLQRAIALSPGGHEIVFTFRPMSLIVGCLITIATLIGLAAALSREYRGRVFHARRRQHPRAVQRDEFTTNVWRLWCRINRL